MSLHETVCTACACLCDDIKVEIEENCVLKIENACARGATFLYTADKPERRAISSIEGKEVSTESAVKKAAQLLRKAKNPFIFGLDNSTLEAQAAGIELARVLRANIDDTSSFCQGSMIQAIFNGDIPTCLLSDLKDSCNPLIIYWGSNPYHSHPRHLSKFSYYPHNRESRRTDLMPEVVLSCVEVRETETSLMCHPVFKVTPGEDGKFIEKIVATLRGIGSTSDSKTFAEMVDKTDFCMIFAGLGLTYSIDGSFYSFIEMVRTIGKRTRIAVVPMVGHFNMRGFNHLLQKETGYVNRVSFASNGSHGEEFSFLEQVRRQNTDCILIVGSDPFSNLPPSLMKMLRDVPIICLDPFTTCTTRSADVVLATALSGLEVGGSAIRMDGERVPLLQAKRSDFPSDEAILRIILDKIR